MSATTCGDGSDETSGDNAFRLQHTKLTGPCAEAWAPKALLPRRATVTTMVDLGDVDEMNALIEDALAELSAQLVLPSDGLAMAVFLDRVAKVAARMVDGLMRVEAGRHSAAHIGRAFEITRQAATKRFSRNGRKQ